jgi:hypothetical protein
MGANYNLLQVIYDVVVMKLVLQSPARNFQVNNQWKSGLINDKEWINNQWSLDSVKSALVQPA